MSNDFFMNYLDGYGENTVLPDELYQHIPHLLRDGCMKMSDPKERELFLLGSLTILSGMMPNVTGNYFQKPVAPNLYCFVIGQYGTGKGALTWSRTIGEALHRQLVDKAREAYKDHHKQMSEYNRKQKLYDKGKLPEPPELPQDAPHYKLYIPANTTKTAVMQLLKENDGRGIIFETEGDTLADMLKQDYGNFSDILRKAYHHEPLSYFRRSNNEDVDIEHPCLSVLLSGTYDQLLRLIPSIENGLFSRFCFYILEGNDTFRNPFASKQESFADHFSYMSEQYAKLYQRLSQRSEPLQFLLTQAQEERFVDLFKEYKEGVQEVVSTDLSGTVNRLGIMCYRIAMIVTILRAFEYDHLQEQSITCTDDTFKIAEQLTGVLFQYALEVYEYVKINGKGRSKSHSSISDEQAKEIWRLHREGYSLRNIAVQVFNDEGKYSTVNRFLNKNKKAG